MRGGNVRNRRSPYLFSLIVIHLIAIFGLSSMVFAKDADHKKSYRNHDAREKIRRVPRRTPSTLQERSLQRFKQERPGLRYRFNPRTGATGSVWRKHGFLTPPSHTDPITTTTQFLESHTLLLGLNPFDVIGYEVGDVVPSKVNGTTHVYLKQRYAGLEIYNAGYHTNLDREGRITGITNGFMPNISTSVNTLYPQIRANKAVALAAEHLTIPITDLPLVLDRGKTIEEMTSVDPAGISSQPIIARLKILPIQEGESRLVWNFQIYTLDHEHWFDFTVDAETGKIWTRFDWVAPDQYKVYPWPAESPNHVEGFPLPPADGRSIVVDPADSEASPASWHSGTSTDGNNVRAYQDSNNTNSGTPVDCGPSLDCDFPVDLTQAPSQYRPGAVTNLFYWNNIIHDIMYQYGFDELSGNFQEDNFGKGGLGGDAVFAEAQDGSGTNNANFATPPDGSNPRMQMYIWTPPNPDTDGDFDNGIIIHEYAHGITNRLVGGPSNVNCLANQQQPGEGWSDWFALALTAKDGDTGSDPRGIGTYALGEPTDGQGIRTQRYSTNPSVNNWTFESIRGAVVPHGVGSVWAQALWEVYWTLVDHYGFDPNLYNATGGAGNQRALLYVTEGLKNTACSPTFLDARDGIIEAVLDTNPEDECMVWQAFADFGLGVNASTTGSNSTATNDFDVPAQCSCSPQPSSDAGPDQTICLGESTTIGTPALEGHTYHWTPVEETTAQILVSPTTTTAYTVTATNACGSMTDSTTVTVDDGSFSGLSENFENGLNGWTVEGLWHLATDSSCLTPGYSSPFNAIYYGQDSTCNYSTGGANTGSLISPPIPGIQNNSTLTFDYYRQVENYAGDYDWTRVEVSADGGSTWSTIWSQNARNPSLNTWNSSGPIPLGSYAGSTIQVRFTFDTVDNVENGFTGWFIDDVVITGESQCGGGNLPPTATITTPADGSTFEEGTSISFDGSGNDQEDGDVTSSLIWSSSINNALGNGGSVSAILSVGTHSITATATDSQGATGGDSITVIVNNILPTVTITSPTENETIEEGDSINLMGTANDPVEEDLSGTIVWNSSIDGVLGTGASISATLSPGIHTVTASATDSHSGTGSASIIVTVNNILPTVAITSPTEDQTIDEGESVNLSGTANDPVEGDLSGSIVWSSSINGVLGVGSSISANLSAGVHVVSASVSDSHSGTSSQSIMVTVNNMPPTVSITTPSSETTFPRGTLVTFSGIANDPGEGNVSASIAWDSSIDGPLGSGASISVSTLSVGTHSINASVTDSGGLTDTKSISVTIDSAGGNPVTVTLYSIGAEDGWILEFLFENSNMGGSSGSGSSGRWAIRAGDDSSDRQWRSILSFDTSVIPAGATITEATVQLRRAGLAGTNPFQTHGQLLADVKTGAFGEARTFASTIFKRQPLFQVRPFYRMFHLIMGFPKVR